MLFCSHGIKKCVPSLTTVSFTPEYRSKITALEPPLTSYIEDCKTVAPSATGTAHLYTDCKTFAILMVVKMILEWGRLVRESLKLCFDDSLLLGNVFTDHFGTKGESTGIVSEANLAFRRLFSRQPLNLQ